MANDFSVIKNAVSGWTHLFNGAMLLSEYHPDKGFWIRDSKELNLKEHLRVTKFVRDTINLQREQK